MAMNNRRRRAPRHLDLGLADPPIVVPEAVYAEAREKNRRSVVGRLLCPGKIDLHPLLNGLPLHWNVYEYGMRVGIIGRKKVQFLFENERDLEMFLWSGPYTYNGWLVVMQRWEDEQGPDFPKSVPIWVKIRGIPVHCVCEGTVREIVKSMGEVMEIELDDTTYDLSFVRVRVNFDVDRRVCFKKVVRFGSGEAKIVSFRYEDIARSALRFKHCLNCGDLNHFTKSCSHVWVDVPDPNDRSSLSPPPLDENNCEGGSSQIEDLPDGDGDGEGKQPQGLDEDSEMVGTSSEGSKRKLEAVEEDDDDDFLDKRIRRSSHATQGFGFNLNDE